jgi:hypothetical protein
MFGVRKNIIVPNVSWGMFRYELDMVILTPAGVAYEVEIKTSKADLKADLLKPHKHFNMRIQKLYFALPYYLLPDCEYLIPENAGIINIRYDYFAHITRQAKKNNDYKFTDAEKMQLMRLGCMRMWPMKETLRDRKNNIKERKHIEADLSQEKMEL